MIPLIWMLVAAALAQPERAAFEVASIKTAKPVNGPLRVTTPETPGGISYTNVTLKNCVRRAYGVMPYLIFGGPAWLDTERFLIDARAGSQLTHPQLMLMLQSLLEGRFKLGVHREKKEIPVYELTVMKGGVKLKAAKDDNTQIDSTAQHAFVATAVSMQLLAGALRVDRPVFDATGLAGRYDVTLDFASDDPFGAFNALQQVGLKLEPRKRMMDALVIDHAEMPAEN